LSGQSDEWGKDPALPDAQAKAQQQKMSAKTAKKMAKRHAYTGSAAVSGLSSSLAFTPVQACPFLLWGLPS
jgi:hypothetical protein